MLVTSHDSRKINQEYQEKMVSLVAGRMFRKVFLPAPIAAAYTVWRSIAFVWKGVRCLLHRKLEVEVLDALSITASLLRGDYSTATTDSIAPTTEETSIPRNSSAISHGRRFFTLSNTFSFRSSSPVRPPSFA